jgi:PAS domain S-box-containing protein
MDFIRNIGIERKIEVNDFTIKARWFYMVGFLLIGFMSKILSWNQANISFSYELMVILFIFGICVNLSFVLFYISAKRKRSESMLDLLGVLQLVFELFLITVITHYAGGIESVAMVFYFLPVISSSLLFGLKGALITAAASSFLINFLMIYEYTGLIPHVNRYGMVSFEYAVLRISATKSITLSIMFFIAGAFSGFGARQLLRREQLLKENAESLNTEKKSRESELSELDKATRLLIKRDKEMTDVNVELDKKIKDLKKAEKSMLRAFEDLNTERKKAEHERSKTESIIANLIDPIIVLDAKNNIALFNPSARKIFLLSEEDIGKRVSSENDYSLKNFEKFIKVDFKIKKKEENFQTVEEEVEVAAGEQEITYKVITAIVKDSEGNYLGIMKVFYNLTREKMIDKLKSEFISIAAHQLRTPLSAIKWVIKMILDGDAGSLNSEQSQLLKKGYESNERIIQLVNDMLNVSRIEEGRFGYLFKKDNISTVFDNAISNLSLKINSKSINFTYDKPKSEIMLKMDFQKMVLAIQNLLDNSIKYTPDKGKINISIEKTADDVEIRIKDNGIGIPKDDQEKLFTKFFRAANVLRTQSEGSGLGLFMVRNIIKKHGGEIKFESREGIGTEFIINIPFKNNDEIDII